MREADVIAAAVARGARIVICARSAVDAARVRRDRGLRVRDVVYASSVRVVCGLCDFEVIEVDGFGARRDAGEIRALLAREYRKSAGRRAAAASR